MKNPDSGARRGAVEIEPTKRGQENSIFGGLSHVKTVEVLRPCLTAVGGVADDMVDAAVFERCERAFGMDFGAVGLDIVTRVAHGAVLEVAAVIHDIAVLGNPYLLPFLVGGIEVVDGLAGGAVGTGPRFVNDVAALTASDDVGPEFLAGRTDCVPLADPEIKLTTGGKTRPISLGLF